MKVRYDDTDIELTQEFVDALIALMKADCAMMRLREPRYADYWTWGRAYISDLSSSKGIDFEFGGDDSEPGYGDGLGQFAVVPHGRRSSE